MAEYTGTKADDNFKATSGVDHFYFGENEGTDLILDFDPKQDVLTYTDRSVDGFDDLDITRLSNGDTVVESNDQITVLHGIDPYDLTAANFSFTTSGPRGTIEDARDPDDINEPPDEVNARDINQRVVANGGTVDDGGTHVVDGGHGGGNHGLGNLAGELLGSLSGLGSLSRHDASSGTHNTADAGTAGSHSSSSGLVHIGNFSLGDFSHVSDHALFGGRMAAQGAPDVAATSVAAPHEAAPVHHGDHIVS